MKSLSVTIQMKAIGRVLSCGAVCYAVSFESVDRILKCGLIQMKCTEQ